jgi:demethylmenaquinone methyltransferase/2-methoxy-6-polyprenyl-1,4-benzoquinol methylase
MMSVKEDSQRSFPLSKEIRKMFDGISGRYDFLNHVLSLGRDRAWRKKAVKKISLNCELKVLDLCGGTGDFLYALQKNNLSLELKVIGDFSRDMLNQCLKKNSGFSLVQLDALHLPFNEAKFDVVLCGYGIRNLDSLERGLSQVHTLLRAGGIFITLDFFRPDQFVPKLFYHFLAPLFIPLLGGLFSRKKRAYHYLLNSIKTFLTIQEYGKKLEEAGFGNIQVLSCDMGLSHIATASKSS